MTHNAAFNVIKGAVAAPRVFVDEDLWFGSFDEESAEKAAANSMAATAGQVLGAKPFPESTRRLAELAGNDASQTREMVQVLEQDPALSAKLLKIVNSAGFGLRQQCTSVSHAVTLMGSKHLYHMATTASVLDMFDSESQFAIQILEHSAVVGALARYFGSHLALPTEELFTAGVLHDIGKLMLLDTMPEQYHQLLEQTNGQADALHILERSEYGFDHGVLAAHVLKAWNIPNPIPKVVAWLHQPARAYESSSLHAGLVQTVRLADALVYAMGNGATRDDVAELVRHEAASYLDISEAQLGSMWDELESLHGRAVAQHRGASEPGTAGDSSASRLRTQPKAKVVTVPQNFPCVDCGQPTFGTTCPACKGNTCPNHPLVSEGWCTVCATEYVGFASSIQFPMGAKRATLAALGVVASTTAIVYVTNAGNGLIKAVLAGFLFAAFVAGILLVANRLNVRSRFVKSRPDRSVVSPRQ